VAPAESAARVRARGGGLARIKVDGSLTLADFHEAIFDAFDRWDSHAYEFITRDADGIALRSYVHPTLYRRDRPSASGLDPEDESRQDITQI